MLAQHQHPLEAPVEQLLAVGLVADVPDDAVRATTTWSAMVISTRAEASPRFAWSG